MSFLTQAEPMKLSLGGNSLSKTSSRLFAGTKGTAAATWIEEGWSVEKDETTASVWGHINPTAENYPNSKIPRSFVVDVPNTIATPSGKMWTHGNATEHMYEAMISIQDNPMIKASNPNLYAQFILYDFYKSLARAVMRGIKFSGTVSVGSWEFAFAKPRSGAKYPVVKHALFKGLQHRGAK